MGHPGAWKGKHLSAAHRTAIGVSLKGRPRQSPSSATLAKLRTSHLGKHHSPATLAKMKGHIPWNKGVPNTIEARAKMSAAAKKREAYKRAARNRQIV